MHPEHLAAGIVTERARVDGTPCQAQTNRMPKAGASPNVGRRVWALLNQDWEVLIEVWPKPRQPDMRTALILRDLTPPCPYLTVTFSDFLIILPKVDY